MPLVCRAGPKGLHQSPRGPLCGRGRYHRLCLGSAPRFRLAPARKSRRCTPHPVTHQDQRRIRRHSRTLAPCRPLHRRSSRHQSIPPPGIPTIYSGTILYAASLLSALLRGFIPRRAFFKTGIWTCRDCGASLKPYSVWQWLTAFTCALPSSLLSCLILLMIQPPVLVFFSCWVLLTLCLHAPSRTGQFTRISVPTTLQGRPFIVRPAATTCSDRAMLSRMRNAGRPQSLAL